MALYHFSVKQVFRGKGQTVVNSAAYISGQKLYNDYYGQTHDYTKKSGVVFTEILTPEYVPERLSDRETLWNEVEQIEKSKRAQLAYSFDIALQNELTLDENIELAREFCWEQFVARGMIVDLAVHEGKSKNEDELDNPHFHANLSKVMVIDGSEEALTLSDDRIEKAVRQNHVRLVIIDQVQAFIGADVDMNRANEVRPVFRKLGMIAEKTGCAIVLIGHLNKSSGTQSTYRGLGSIDIMAAVRSLIFIGKVRKDPTTRVLIHEKSSLAPPGETMAFKLGDEEGFRWVGAYEISADELLDGKEGKATETKLERGTKLIKELLADKKEISIRELDEKAKEQGISGRTMRDVRSRMKNELEYRVNEKQENSIRLKE